MRELVIREAAPSDIPALTELLRELAAWENLTGRFQLTEAQLHQALFVSRVARAAIGRIGDEPAAMALYYPHFASFTGRTTLYMEELVVLERFRGGGVGRKMMAYLARLALREGFHRLEWPCMLDNPSALLFYDKLGATRLDDRVGLRLDRAALERLAGGDE
jgi:GNAT superfamily N-acetyltransferase